MSTQKDCSPTETENEILSCPLCRRQRFAFAGKCDCVLDPGRITTAELLADLRGRIARAIDSLMELREAPGTDVARLSGKIQALQLVQDWLRSYPNEEKTR